MQTAQAHLLIEGRVQGVFYRAFTREVAARLGLKGWVRNLYDGRVEAVFEGSKPLIEKAIEECRKGPRGSAVENIDIEWKEPSGKFALFDIHH
jgi:acylphosphatase